MRISAFLAILYRICSSSSNCMTSVSEALQYNAFSDSCHYQTKSCCNHNKGATLLLHVDATNDSNLKSPLCNCIYTSKAGEGEGQIVR
jgi:hypothetical protein